MLTIYGLPTRPNNSVSLKSYFSIGFGQRKDVLPDVLFVSDSEPTYVTAVDRTKLPTAPKAARGPEDLSRVPTSPPFTAFIGNLPYEASEEKIRDFFSKLPVSN